MGAFDTLLMKSRRLATELSADNESVGDSLHYCMMVSRLSRSAVHVEKMLNGSKREKKYGPRVRLAEARKNVSDLIGLILLDPSGM